MGLFRNTVFCLFLFFVFSAKSVSAYWTGALHCSTRVYENHQWTCSTWATSTEPCGGQCPGDCVASDQCEWVEDGTVPPAPEPQCNPSNPYTPEIVWPYTGSVVNTNANHLTLRRGTNDSWIFDGLLLENNTWIDDRSPLITYDNKSKWGEIIPISDTRCRDNTCTMIWNPPSVNGWDNSGNIDVKADFVGKSVTLYRQKRTSPQAGAGEYVPRDDSYAGITYNGTWKTYSSGRYTDTLNDTVTFTVSTGKVVILHNTSTGHGKMEIRIDGVLVATVDAHTKDTDYRVPWFSEPLTLGSHTVEVKNIQGTGDRMSFNG